MSKGMRILEKMPERIPTSGSFELTVRCNLHCKMCLFRHDDSENSELREKELTAEQWIDMARQAAEAGLFSLTITGGEPLIRPDFCEIWEGIYKQGFIITLYTNATLVTNEVMETLRKYPPHKIGVTLYGASPGIYEMVTGSATAFHQALDGIQKLSGLPSIINYRTTIIKDNYSDVSNIEKLVDKLSDGNAILTETRMVHPSVRGGCADVHSCRLSATENVNLMFRRIKSSLKNDAIQQGIDPKDVLFNIEIDRESSMSTDKKNCSFFGCNAGMDSFTVSYDGYLLPCQILDKFQINILNKAHGFAAAWEELPFIIELPKLCEKCASCNLLDYCEACPATRLAESDDMGGWSQYLCDDAKEIEKHTKLTSIK